MKTNLTIKNLIVLAALIVIFGMCTGLTAMANDLGSYSPRVEQVFISNSINAQSTFTYRIDRIEQDTRTMISTFDITGTGSVMVDPLIFSEPGTYEYEVYQLVSAASPGYTYDSQVYTITARVISSQNIEIFIKNNEGIKVNDISFTVMYELKPTDPKLMADPPIRKTVTGEPAQPGLFTFKLMAKNAAQPMPEGSVNGVKTVKITGNGEAEFGTWSYSEPGIYYYTAAEVNAGELGYTYDTTVYTITDTVTEMNGALVLSRVVTNMANKQVPALSFLNKYTWEKRPSETEKPTDPSNPSGPSNPGTGPKTGDDANTTLYVALLSLGSAITGAALVFLIAGIKSRKKERCDHHE